MPRSGGSVERDADGDSSEVVSSIARAHPGTDFGQLLDDLASARTAVVTLTITEAGYRLNSDGSPDLADLLTVADLALVAEVASGHLEPASARPQTALVRVLLGV